MEISDILLEDLWQMAIETPRRPQKTRRSRIMTKWRRRIKTAQRAYLDEAWNSGETRIVYHGNYRWLMGSSSREDVWHVLEAEEGDLKRVTCSCEAHELGSLEECRHTRRLREIAPSIFTMLLRMEQSKPNIVHRVGWGMVAEPSGVSHA